MSKNITLDNNTKVLQLKLKKINMEKMNTDEVSSIDEDLLLKNDEPSNGDLMNVLINIQKETSGTNKKLESYISSTDKKLDDVNKTIAKNNTEISTLAKKVKSCEDLTVAVNFSYELQKQKNLKNNISISGVPITDEENLTNIIDAIFAFYKVEISKSELQSVYRVKGSRNLIIVRFASFVSKEKLMLAKMEKVIKLSDILSSVSSSSNIDLNQVIYMNNHTTPFFGKLLHQGRLLVRDGKLAASWITSNGFYVKFEENGTPIEIKCSDQLKQLTSNKDTSANISNSNKNNANNGNNNKNNNTKKNKYPTRSNKRDVPDDEGSPNEAKQAKSRFRSGHSSH